MSSFTKGCEECGRGVDIDDQICSKCGFNFTLHPRISPKCPYCEKDLHLREGGIIKCIIVLSVVRY